MADENPDGQKLEDLALNIQRVREQVAQLQARIERVRNEHRQLQRETFLRHKLYQVTIIYLISFYAQYQIKFVCHKYQVNQFSGVKRKNRK